MHKYKWSSLGKIKNKCADAEEQERKEAVEGGVRAQERHSLYSHRSALVDTPHL